MTDHSTTMTFFRSKRMAQEPQQPTQQDRDKYIELTETRKHLDAMNVAAPLPSQTFLNTVASAAPVGQAVVPAVQPPDDYDG